MTREKRRLLIGDIVGVIVTIIIFLTPFYFMFIQSIKSKKESNQLRITWPADGIHFENYIEVIKTRNYMLVTAFKNSIILALVTVAILCVISGMAGYVIQRRHDKIMKTIQWVLLLGLMIPASVLPTINLLQNLHLYKTLLGMILIEVALQTPFTMMLFRGYMASIPVELEEAGRIDGCNAFTIFTRIIFPLLKPIQATIIILTSVTTFNDFTNPLYFLPGNENATVQLTLYNFKGQFSSNYNLLFADIILITVPMLILFLIFNKRIVSGMVAGSVKG